MFLQLYFIFHSVAVYHTVIMAVWCVIVSINHYHRDPPQTSCNELWILLPVSSATHRSTTAACLFCGMKSCTGSMSSTGCATSWQYWHTVRYMGLLHSTWQASSRRRQRSLDVSTCDLLLNRNWSFHGAVRRRLAVERFQWQVRQCGMHYQTVWEIQSWLRHFQASFEDLLLHVILDVSHVQLIRDFLVMRYINVRFTYLLTYLSI